MKSTKPQKTKPTIRFNTKLSENLLVLPKSVNAKLPSQNKTMIEGTINNSPFRAALGSNGHGNHSLKVGKAMRDAMQITEGEKVSVEITRVGDEPETRVPADLAKALKAHGNAVTSWTDITPLARRDWIFSICTARQGETRKRRIEKACDMLSSGKRRLCCFPGVKLIMKENEKSCGMWEPLAKK